MTLPRESDKEDPLYWQILRGMATLILFAAVLAGCGERRNEYHYQRGYIDALLSVEHAARREED